MKLEAQLGYVEVTEPNGNIKRYPCYTCGHCSNVVILRPDRNRPRKSCLQCGRWLCEKSEICNTHCTPLHALAKDHFENAGEFGKYVPAIMKGVTSVREAERLGLVTA
jgi:hypothetical protein